MTPVPELSLQYPLGKFAWPAAPLADGERRHLLLELAAHPAHVRSAISGLTEEQLDTPYRPGGWTVRQVVHHLADSHLNSYVRFKLALTETEPTIKPYDEAAWAELPDSGLPPDVSLSLLEGLHHRWCTLLEGLNEEQWRRRFVHPERGPMNLDATLALYVWHGKHHTAHITGLRDRLGI